MGFTIQFDMSQFIEKNIDKSNITSLEMGFFLRFQTGTYQSHIYISNKLNNYTHVKEYHYLEPKITVEEFFNNSDPNSYGYET